MSSPFNFTRGSDNRPVKKTIQPAERPSVGNASAIGRDQVNLNNLVINGENISIQPESITYLNVQNEGVGEAGRAVILNENLGVENINEISTTELYVDGELVTGLVNKGASVSNSIYLNGIQPGLSREKKIISANDNEEVENVNMESNIVKYNNGSADSDKNEIMQDPLTFESSANSYSYLKFNKITNYFYGAGNFRKIKDLWYHTLRGSTTTITFFEDVEKINGGSFQKVFSINNSTRADTISNNDIAYDPVMDRYLIPIANGTNFSMNISPSGNPSTWTNDSVWQVVSVATLASNRINAPSVKWSSLLNKFITIAENKFYISDNGEVWTLMSTITTGNNGFMNPFVCHEDYIAVGTSTLNTSMAFSIDGVNWSIKTGNTTTRTYAMQYIPEEDIIFISGDFTGATLKASTMVNMATITQGEDMVTTHFNANTTTHIDYYNDGENRFAIINTNLGSGHALYNFKTRSQTFSQSTNFNGTFANGKIYIFSKFIITPFASTRLIHYDIDFNRVFSPKKTNIIVEPEVFLNFEPCSRAIIIDFQWVPKINKYLAIGFANDTYATADYANVCLYHSDDLVNFKFIRDLNSTSINRLIVEEESGFVYCTTILSNSVSIFSNYGRDFVSNYTSVAGIKYFEYSKYFGFTIVGSNTSGVVLLNGMSFLRVEGSKGFANLNLFVYTYSANTSNLPTTAISPNESLFVNTKGQVNYTFNFSSLTTPYTNINIKNFNTNPRTNGGNLINDRTNEYTLPLFIEELGLVVRIRFSSGWSSSHRISYQPLISASNAPIEDWKEITLSSAYFQENNIWSPSLKYDSNSGRLYIVGNSDLQRTKLSAYNLSLDKAPFMKNQLSSYYSRNDSGEEIFPLETIANSGDFNDISYSTGTYIACSNNNLYIGNKISKMLSVSLLGNWNSISSSLSHFVVVGNNKIAVASIEMNSQDISFNILSGNGISDTEWKSVHYSDEIKLWAMCGLNKLAFSSNAINWNILDINGDWKKIKYCNGYWIAVGLNSICFTAQQSPTNSSNISQLTLAGDWRDVEFGGRWIITGAGKTMATISFNKINSSSDWEVLSDMNGKIFNSILYVESLNQYVLSGQNLSIYIQSRNKFFNPTDNLINNLDGKIVKCSMWSERYKSIIMCGNQFIIGSRMMQTGIDNSLFKNDFMDSSSYLSTNSFIKVSDISNSINKSNGYLSIESNTNSNNLLSLKNNTTGDTVLIGASDANKFNINVPSSLNLNTDSLRIEGVEVDRNLNFASLKVDIPGVVGNSKLISTDSNGSITTISHINAGGLLIDDELYSNTIPNAMIGVTDGIVSPDRAVKLDSLKNISGVNSLKTNTIEIDNLTLYSKNTNSEVFTWNSGIKTMDGGTYNINDVCYSASMDIYIALPAYNGVSNLSAEAEKCYILLSKDGQKWYKSYTGLNIILKFIIPIEKMNASLPAFTERRTGLLLFTDGTTFNGLKTFFTPDCINFYPFNYTSTDITSLSTGHNFFLDENTNTISAYNNTTALNLTGLSPSPNKPGTNFKYVFINGGIYMGLLGNNFGFDPGSSLVSTSLTASGTVNYAVRVVGLSGDDSNVDWIYVADSGRILYRNTNGATDSVQGVANTSQVIDASCNFTKIAYNPVIRRLLITASNGKIYISNVGSKTEWVEVVNDKSNLFSMEWSNIRSIENRGFALWHSDNSSNLRTSSKICIVNADGQFRQGYQSFRRNYAIGDYANGMYVLPINETGWGDKIAYSKDGIDWDFSLYLSTEIISVVFFPEINKFVACGKRDVYTSEDAISWTVVYTHGVTSANALKAVYLSDRGRVAIAFSNLSEKQFIHSNDCENWSEVDIVSERNNSLTSMVYSPTLSRIVLSINTSDYQGALYSDDLLTFQMGVNEDTNSPLQPGGRNLMWIKEGGFFYMYAVWQWTQWISNDGINWRVDYFKDKGTNSDITISNTFDPLNNIFVPSHGDLISFNVGGSGSNICKISNQIFKLLAPVNANSNNNDYNLLIYNQDRNEILVYKSKEGSRKGDVFYVLDLEDLKDITTKEICVDYIDKLYNNKLPINNYLETDNIIPLPNSTLDGGAEDSSLLTTMYNNLTVYTNNLDSFTPSEIFWCKELETLFISTNNSVVRTNNGVDFVTCISNFRATSICYSPSLSRLVAVSSNSAGGRVATSIDGEIWTIVSSSNDGMLWNKVIWAEGLSLFIACSMTIGVISGDSNKFMTSPDGLVWTSREAPNNSLGYICIAYSPLLNVVTALSTNITRGAYSTNGIDWFHSNVTGGTTNHLNVIWAPKHGVFLGVSATTIIKSVDGFTWTLNNTITSILNDIVWCEEIEKVILVGPGSIIISSDLMNWQTLSSARATTNFCRVTWSSKFNSIFLTYEGGVNCVMRYVDYKSTLLDSYDVINSSTWKNICWSPTLSIFVAVSDSGRDPFLISSDGNVWRRANFNSTRESLQIAGICWSPQLSLFVAVSGNGWKRALTSSNGDDWIERNTPGDIVNSWVDVCWSPELSLFVAVANTGTHRIMTSSNGENWTIPTTVLERSVLNSISLQNICWSPSLSTFIAVSNSTITSMNIIKSSDGVNWTLHSAPIANLRSICWSPQLSLFVAVANAGTNRIITSKNGDYWTVVNSVASGYSLENIIWTGIKFIIASFDTNNRGIIFESKDGLNWTQVYERTITSNLQAVAYSQSLNKYVVVSNSGTDRIVSVDEVVEEQIITNSSIYYKESMNVLEYGPSDNTRNWTDVIYIPQQKRLVACCNNGTNGRIMISDNYGISWSSPSITVNSSLVSIAYGRFATTWKMVAIQKSSTTNSNILGNTDNGTWSQSGFNFPMAECICSSEELSLFVVVRSSGTGRVNTSSNGTTWSSQTSSDENSEWSYVVWSPKLSLFVAVARNGDSRVMTSVNGIDWTSQTLSDGLELCAWENVCWSSKENLFVAVSSAGSHKMMKSSNGINWQAVSSSAFTSAVKRITWCEGGDIFTAILSLGSERLIYSKDLINWETRVALNDTTEWNSICWIPDANCGIAVSNAPTSKVMRFQLENSPIWKAKPVVSIDDTTNSWNSVVWSPELELYVAVANSGANRIMISEDGGEWILPSTVPAGVDSTSWQSVCWSSSLSLFVAVANNGTNRVMTSLDGLTWQLRVSAVADTSGWSSVCWSPELSLFIAVAQTGTNRIMYSSDGITWINTGLTGWNNSNGWTYVCWVPTISIFVALSSSGSNRIARSSNGTDWANITMPAGTDGNNWISACWSQELKKIVAVANSGNGNTRVITSVDGINWGLSISSSYINFSSISWSAEIRMFVGVANSGTMKAMTSADGLTWNFIGSSNNLNTFTCIIWNNSLNSFIATASSGTNRIMNILVDRNNITQEYNISTPPSDFTISYNIKSIVPSKALTVPLLRTSSGETNIWSDICWSPELSLFVAVAQTGANRVMTSQDGINWTGRLSAGETNAWNGVCWSPELTLFVAVARSGANRVMTSPDGITWTSRLSAGEDNEWRSVCWSPELTLFVAVDSVGTNRVMTSPDGINWTARVSSAEANSAGPGNDWQSVCWSSELSLFVAVAPSGTNRVMTSPDGINWTGRISAGEANQWRSVCWSPELSLFVAVAGLGTNRVMTSPDGINWISQVSASENWQSVCWSSQLYSFVAVGGVNAMFSSDGIIWTSLPSVSTSSSMSSICWSPALSIFVTVSVSGTNRVANIYERIQLTPTATLSAVETNSWKSICYSEELSLFASVSNDGVNRVMTSPDGINWTPRLSAEEGNGWIDICWSPTLAIFLAIAESGTNRIMTSSDGITWVSMLTTGENNQWSSVCWSPKLSLFVGVSQTGTSRVLIIEEVKNLEIVSAIGINSVDSNDWRSVCWSEEDSVFLSVASSGVNRVMSSTDGVNWYQWESTGENNEWQDVSWGKQLSRFASVASSGTNRLMTTRIAKETSITAVERISAGELNEWYDVSWSEELLLFIAVAKSGTGRVMSSKDGIVWETYSSDADTNEWDGVCWSPQRSMYVAVASSGENRVINVVENTVPNNSVEELVITARASSNENNNWRSVCWSEELLLFVAVASTGTNRVMTSVDGITWSSQVSAVEDNEWWSICWSPELSLFVAVAKSGTDRVMTSLDGITWAARVSAGETNEWLSVCWSSDLSLFVAVAKSGTNRVMTSLDGINWTARLSAEETNEWNKVIWFSRSSLFVAVAQNGTNRIMTSPDGITWTSRLSSGEENSWMGICDSPSLEIAVAVSRTGVGRVMNLTGEKIGDVISNSLLAGETSLLESNEWRSICYSETESRFVAVASSGTNRVMNYGIDDFSVVGRISSGEANNWSSVCWSEELSLFVAVAQTGANKVMTSLDGINWTSHLSAGEANEWRSICWSEELSLFVAVASSGTNRVMTSLNGINWSALSSAGESNAWISVCWSPELSIFVAVAYSGTNRVMTSEDGINWTARVSAGETNQWISVCWSPELSLFVAVASTGSNKVMTSPDGITWSPQVSADETNAWWSVCWSSELSLFVAVAISGANRVMTSPDGINWTARVSAGETNQWRSVCWSPELSLFVAVAANGVNKVMYSKNGSDWYLMTSSNESNLWCSVCWSPKLSMFVSIAFSTGTNKVMNITPPAEDNYVVKSRLSSNETNSWWGVCRSEELSLFVAVSISGTGRVMTSQEGRFWTSRTSAGETNSWRSVCWSPQLLLFVAVSSDGVNRVMTSSNGINWTIRDGCPGVWQNVKWIPQLEIFVAVANAGVNRIMTSKNGSVWTAYQSSNETNSWNSIAWSPLLNMAVSVSTSGTDRVMNISDLGTKKLNIQSKLSSAETNGWTSICWSEELSIFTAVSQTGTGRAMTSSDGCLWTTRAGSANEWKSICWSPFLSLFVAVSVTGTNRVMTSPNGITWTLRVSAVDANRWMSVTWSPQFAMFVAVAELGSNRIMISNDGINWIPMTSSVETNGWQDICWSPTLSMFSVVSSSGVNRIMNLQQISYAPTVLTTSISSIDRIITPLETAQWSSISWSPKLGLFSALSSGNSMYSYDGIVWKASLSTLSIGGNWQSMCWSEDLSIFLAVASSGSRRVCVSKDGIRWDSYLSSSESNNWASVVWSSELRMFVAVASSGTNRVMYSYDGVNWVSTVSANDSASWGNVCWSPDLHMFVAVASGGTGNRIMTSSNGITWVSNSFASTLSWSGVCWSPLLKLFVIVSYSGANRIAYSSNGVSWTQIASPIETATWYRVMWIPEVKTFISISNTGDIMESFNGIAWQTVSKQNSIYLDMCWSPLLRKCVAISSSSNYRITSMDLVEFPSEYENHLESIERVEVSGGEGNNWSSLTWSPELGLFAGLAYLGNKRSMYSYDGVNWNVKLDNEIEDNGWVSSCWSPQLSLFVAVSFNGTGRVAISSNGKDWDTATTAHDSVDWRSVVWCEQLSVFVAVGSNGTNRVMRSSDGINWTRYSVELSNWHGVTWSPELGLFVAIADGGSGNRIMRSSNGINWTSTAQGKDNVWGYGAWSKELGLFVIVARGGTNRIAYSSDGVNWTQIASPLETVNWRNIVWIAEVGLFIVTSHTGHIMESDNGIDWRIISEQGVNYGSLAWSPLLRICIAGSWTLTERITIMKLRNSRLTTPLPTITSYDFGTYNNNFSIINTIATSTAYSESLDIYVGVCSHGSRKFIYSSDSISWTSSTLTTSSLNSSTWIDVCWNDSLSIFVAIANTGNNRIAKSTDGKNWIEISPVGFSKSWSSIVSREAVLTGDTITAMIIAVSSTGDVLRSIDGVDWSVISTGNESSWKSITWGNGKFVAVANSGANRVMTSPDGINWELHNIIINTNWISVCHSNDLNRFVAVANNTHFAFSDDGINWELSPAIPSPGVWTSISRSDSLGLFVASSNSNYIGISYDGLTWISKTVLFDSKLISKIVWNEYKNKFFMCSNSISIMSSSLDLVTPPVLSLNSKVKWDLTWSSSIQMFMAFKKSDPFQDNQQLLLSSNGRSWIADTTNFTQAAKKSITSYTEVPNFSCLYMCRNTNQVQYVSPGGIGVISVSGFNVNCVFYSNPLGVLIMGNSNSNILLMGNLLRTGSLQGVFIQSQLPKIMTIGNIAVCKNNHIILENGETSTYYYSYDLNNFTLATLPSKAEWHFASKVIYNDDGSIYNDLVIGVSNTGFIIRSTNGINWNIVKNYNVLESNGSRRFSNVKYIEELNAFVVCDEVRKTNCIVYTMDDGLTWADVNLSSSASISDITFSAYLDSFLILSLPDGNGNLVSMLTLPKLPSGGNVMNKTVFNISPNGGMYTGEILTNNFLSNTLETMPLLALSTNSAYKPTTSTWTVNSDSRLKENIVDMDIDECLELIDKLELKYYKWKDEFSNNVEEEDKHKLGFIAQEVEALIPDAVYNIGNMYGYEGVKSINQDQILAILYGAIQSLIIRYENIQKN